jgi:guanosine-3',5'-bis(diphosphate) 3'-pyrophosphohydrolase
MPSTARRWRSSRTRPALGRPALAAGRHAPVFTVSLDITISNDAGVLGRICTLIGEQKANISDLRFTDRKPDFYRLIIDVDLRDVEHLHMVMTALEAETDVAQISRHRDLTRRP